MQVGSQGSDVQAWQHTLNELKYFPLTGAPLVEDGNFGPKTAEATRLFQKDTGFIADGIVTPALLAKAAFLVTVKHESPSTEPTLPSEPYPFIPAKNYTPANRSKIDLIVIHTMEAPEKPTTARNVATWFGGKDAPVASAHYCIDNKNIIQSVRDTDVAWHAPGANSNGLGLEHAGFASQTPDQWKDDYSLAVLANSAALAAVLCKRWNIPIVRLTAADLKLGKRGFCGHIDCTQAFSNGKGHVDPGPNFPWDAYLAQVAAALEPPSV